MAQKPDSQEICFVPDQDHARFIRQHRGNVDTGGEIVTTDGVVVGRHQGLEQFTIGQRKGLRIAFGQPRYVVRIEAGSRDGWSWARKDELARRELTAAGANWLAPPPGRCQVKIRYRSEAVAATVETLSGGRFAVRFDERLSRDCPWPGRRLLRWRPSVRGGVDRVGSPRLPRDGEGGGKK